MLTECTIESYSLATLGKQMKQEAAGSLLGRHVSWIRKPRNGLDKIGAGLLTGMEVVALALSIVGIYAIIKGNKIVQTLKKAEALEKNTKVVAPPVEIDIIMKTKTESVNHRNNYAIHDDVLWYKTRKDTKWKLLYFDGYLSGVKPVEVQVDEANLVVLDENREFHYKKVLIEYRRKGKYTCKDISAEDNWFDRWYSLPIIEKIYHIFAKKRLKLPENSIWAISHRGKFVWYYEDIRGKRHREFPMVTTLYSVTEDGKDVSFDDPFLMPCFKHIINGPDPKFKIELISASASMVFLSGKLDGRTKRYRRMIDYDILGKNIFHPAFWSKKFRPEEKWEELPDLPDEQDEAISIEQTGEGNAARTFHVKTISGIYEYHIGDKGWRLAS